MSDYYTGKAAQETALFNLDQPILLGPVGSGSGEYSKGYQEGLKRGAIEALCMVLGFEHNVNEIWQRRPLTIERGKYGRYGGDND